MADTIVQSSTQTPVQGRLVKSTAFAVNKETLIDFEHR